jgi:hypothetical protein
MRAASGARGTGARWLGAGRPAAAARRSPPPPLAPLLTRRPHAAAGAVDAAAAAEAPAEAGDGGRQAPAAPWEPPPLSEDVLRRNAELRERLTGQLILAPLTRGCHVPFRRCALGRGCGRHGGGAGAQGCCAPTPQPRGRALELLLPDRVRAPAARPAPRSAHAPPTRPWPTPTQAVRRLWGGGYLWGDGLCARCDQVRAGGAAGPLDFELTWGGGRAGQGRKCHQPLRPWYPRRAA